MMMRNIMSNSSFTIFHSILNVEFGGMHVLFHGGMHGLRIHLKLKLPSGKSMNFSETSDT